MLRGHTSAYVNPYDGVVYEWDVSDASTFHPPTGPILTRMQAQPIAVSAFTQYAASILRTGDSTNPSTPTTAEPVWGNVNPLMTMCCLQYKFYFSLALIEDPNYDPVADGPYNGRPPSLTEVTIDAETGEVVNVEPVNASGSGGNLKNVKFSPRIRLIQTLAKDRANLPLLRAVASGKPVTAKAPAAKTRRITRRVADKPLTFVLDAKARLLLWESEPGKWAGVALPEKEAAAVQKYLAAPVPPAKKILP